MPSPFQCLKHPISLGVAAALVAPVAFAQIELEEVIVTATKREESSQDIPLSIEIVGGEQMADMGIVDFTELQSTVPNLNVAYGITTQVIAIRGLGSGQERSFEQSVGMFIDGFYMPRSRQYQSPFFDVARVEVARGPQSAIHGLNSTAGAISIVTNRTMPGDPFVADITAEGELEYGGGSISAIIGGSAGESFGLRAALKFSDRDGYFENSFTGQDEGDLEDTLARITAVWQASDAATVTLKYETAERDMDGNTGELFNFAAGRSEEPGDNRLDFRRSSNGCAADPLGLLGGLTVPGLYSDTCPRQRTDLETFLAKVDWDLGWSDLTVLAGRSEFTYDITVDLDTTSDAFVDSGIDENFEQDAFEVRLTSSGDGNVDWIAGLYWHDWENFNENPATFGPGTLGGLLSAAGPFGFNAAVHTTATFDQSSDLKSLFGQATWHVSDRLRVIGGARWTDEKKTSAYTVPCALIVVDSGTVIPQELPGPLGLCNSNPAVDGLSISRSTDNFLPELAVQWDANEDVMLYAKLGESAKSGGFTSSTRNPAASWSPRDQEYDDEEVFGFEVGMKSRWLDDRLEFNVAAYDTEFDDLQVNTFTPIGMVISQRVTNAAKASSKGVEMDLRYAATEYLQLGVSAAFQDVEYDNFVNGTCSIASGLASPCDQSGTPLPLAADYSANAYADFAMPIGSGNLEFVARLNVYASDGYFTDAAQEPAGEQDSYTKVDARVGIAAADGRWEVALVGRNLTDERVLGASQSFFNNLFQPTYLGYLEPPRTILLQARYRFGGE